MKQVPDLVEELEVDPGGKLLDRSWLRFIPSEYDEHALEQALLVKEEFGGTVDVFAVDIGEPDEMLYTALAKGADRAFKITGEFDYGLNNHTLADVYLPFLKREPYEMILNGVQAIDDIDGPIGPILATKLGLPYVGVVSGMKPDPSTGTVHLRKEYPRGVLAEFRVAMPVFIGIQAAMKPPRYVPIARIQKAMRAGGIVEVAAEAPLETAQQVVGFDVERMYKPEAGRGAEMIEGSPEEIAERIFQILNENGLVR
ncbi:MAG: electron transfer flavoprotein subunit beta [Bacteroidota bacterium]|nr:electron transfer flavoprotein subunit beta [Bacteroidota bacterium]